MKGIRLLSEAGRLPESKGPRLGVLQQKNRGLAMERFFHPGSVAVVGASEKNIGGFVVQNLANGFAGSIYPVNPNYSEIQGIACYGSVTDIPAAVDLAVLLVPARAVPSVLEECAEKGISRVIIESAGFSETGSEGIALQQRCEAIAAGAGIRLWGPNCMGFVDVRKNHFFTFMTPSVREELLPGRVSLIVQSGMMSAIFLAELGRRGIGVSKACSIGNRADVDECDIISYLQDDPDTDVIALYLESIPRGRLFARLAEQSEKPLVLLKGGESRAGALAAMSHTSSLSGNSRLLNSVLALSGVIRAEGVYQMMDMANALSLVRRLNPACRTAIVTISGGAGILACDALERCGIAIAELSEQSRKEAAKVFPSWMPVSNPVDLYPAVALNGRMRAYEGAFSALLKDPQLDVLVIHFIAGLDESAPDLSALRQMADQHGKLVVFWLMGREEGSRQFLKQARDAGILVFDDPLRLARCLQAVAVFSARRDNPPASRTASQSEQQPASAGVLPALNKTWDEFDSKRFLSDWNIPVAAEQLVASNGQLRQAAEHMGFPLVLKGLLPGDVHKTESGLVRLGLPDESALESAYRDVAERTGQKGRILVQQQVPFDYELIAGFLRDEHFGACVMFGLGGTLAELEPDVAFALAPLDTGRALQAIRSLRNRRLFQGFRGKTPLDEEAAARILVHLGNAGTAYSQIEQIDINPLVVSAGQPVAVDATVILAD